MIAIGVDPHADPLAGGDRASDCRVVVKVTVKADEEGHARPLAWGRALDGERVFALEDGRHVSCRLERFLLGRGERWGACRRS
jgi:hypothetical protein